MTVRFAALALLFLLGGCRAAHERLVAQRLVQTQLFSADLPVPLVQADALLIARRADQALGPCEPCLLSLKPLSHTSRRVCTLVGEREGCVVITGTPGGVRLSAVPGDPPLPAEVARALWAVLDPRGAAAATAQADQAVPLLAAEEEEAFTPRPGAFATVRSSVVMRGDKAHFGFGGQAGARVWVNYFLVLGLGVEGEFNVVPFSPGYATFGPHLRGEVSLWREENVRLFNAPFLSVVMSVTPLIAAVRGVPAGVRAMFGLQLSRVGRFPTPLLFEVGFQSITVGGLDATGPRVALGFGF